MSAVQLQTMQLKCVRNLYNKLLDDVDSGKSIEIKQNQQICSFWIMQNYIHNDLIMMTCIKALWCCTHRSIAYTLSTTQAPS